MKKLERIARGAAAVLLAFAVTGCSNAAEGNYLDSIKASKYVTLGAYTGQDIQVDALNIDPEEVEAYVTSQMSALPPAPVTGRAAQMGDTVNIDYKGKLVDTGVYFSGGTAEGQTIILGSGVLISGFEEGIVGMEIGQTKELALTFPENYKGSWKREIFKNDNPVHIEIGMGKGRFIMELAERNPDINYIICSRFFYKSIVL